MDRHTCISLEIVIFICLPNQNFSIQFDPLRAHPPSASASACVIPLASQPEIRLHYVNKTNMTRFGKILEDLDTFAGLFLLFSTEPFEQFHKITESV